MTQLDQIDAHYAAHVLAWNFHQISPHHNIVKHVQAKWKREQNIVLSARQCRESWAWYLTVMGQLEIEH